MPNFEYTAINRAGKRVSGLLAAVSEQAALQELETQRLTPVTVAARGEGVGTKRRVPARKLGEAYQQLADLLHAGVPLLRSLRLLGGRKSAPRLAEVFRELADSVSEGDELAKAMAARPEVFSSVHTAMVQAGEKGGFLETVLNRLAQLVTRQADLRSSVLGNLAYPAVLVGVGVLVLGVVFGVFIPQFRPVFEKIEAERGLPTITTVVFAISDAIGRFGLPLGIGLAAAGIGLAKWSKRPEMRARIAHAKTRLPVLGRIVRALAAARFCRMLGTLLGSGVPMIASMQIARDAAGNALMEAAIDDAVDAVRAGQPLAPPLGQSGLFEDDVVEMIAVGESANNLDDVLLNIADTLEKRIDRMLTIAVRLLEPLLILVVAGCVGLIAGALIVPLTRMGSNL